MTDSKKTTMAKDRRATASQSIYPVTEGRKQCIKNVGFEDFAESIKEMGQPPYRATQIFDWIYKKNAGSFDDMSNLAQGFRAALDERYTVDALKIEKTLVSTDGTKKFLYALAGGGCIESVLIPDRGRITLCVSTQAGCAMGCAFCMTGKGGLKRSLDAAEILDQVLIARRTIIETMSLSNIVFMGMGEPLANYDEFLKAIRMLTDSMGVAMSPSRITFSTAGLIELINKAADEFPPVGLAVSLNATDDKLRSEIMPVAKGNPIKGIIDAARGYSEKTGGELTFEYVVLGGLNDSNAEARRLAALLRGVRCKVNLIAFNPFPGSKYARPAHAAVEAFRDELKRRGIFVFMRRGRGGEIGAACGQLGGEE